ncbi:MAG: hypothetical protein WC531_01740 [Candidatus Paceibacterota bacterium]
MLTKICDRWEWLTFLGKLIANLILVNQKLRRGDKTWRSVKTNNLGEKEARRCSHINGGTTRPLRDSTVREPNGVGPFPLATIPVFIKSGKEQSLDKVFVARYTASTKGKISPIQSLVAQKQ